MRKIEKNEAASYCCEASEIIDVNSLIENTDTMKKIDKVEAASYCCEASDAVDISLLISE